MPSKAAVIYLPPLQVMVMTHTHAKGQGRRSVSFKDIVETNGQRSNSINPILTWSVIKLLVMYVTVDLTTLVI